MKKTSREKIIEDYFKTPVLVNEVKEKFDRSRATNLAYHKEMEIHIVKEGKGFYFIQNRKYQFEKDNVIVIHPGQQHFQLVDYPYKIEKFSLYLSPLVLKNFKFSIRGIKHKIKIPEKELPKIYLMIDIIKNELKAGKKYRLKLIYHCISIIFTLFKRWSLNEEISEKEKNPVVDKLIDFLNKNFTRKIKIADLSKLFHKSESYLSHIFNEYTGMGIKEYIIQKRVLESKKIMKKNPHLKLEKVSEKVGFSSFSLYNRAFKRITGITPSSYKNLIEKKQKISQI